MWRALYHDKSLISFFQLNCGLEIEHAFQFLTCLTYLYIRLNFIQAWLDYLSILAVVNLILTNWAELTQFKVKTQIHFIIFLD